MAKMAEDKVPDMKMRNIRCLLLFFQQGIP